MIVKNLEIMIDLFRKFVINFQLFYTNISHNTNYL